MNQKLLLKKFNYAEIRDVANNLISSYHYERHQIVKLNNKLGHSLIVNHGVPQRTVFGRYYLYYI